jgi:hypothetical protein
MSIPPEMEGGYPMASRDTPAVAPRAFSDLSKIDRPMTDTDGNAVSFLDVPENPQAVTALAAALVEVIGPGHWWEHRATNEVQDAAAILVALDGWVLVPSGPDSEWGKGYDAGKYDARNKCGHAAEIERLAAAFGAVWEASRSAITGYCRWCGCRPDQSHEDDCAASIARAALAPEADHD